MAKCYVVEIGLDGNVAPRYDGTYSHSINLIQVDGFDAAWGTPWVFTDFQADDMIAFRACDYTEPTPGDPPLKLELEGMFIRFLNPGDPRLLSPCVDEPLLCSGKDYYPDTGDPSLVIQNRTGWKFFGTPLNAKKRSSGTSFRSAITERFCTFKEGKYRALLRISIVATCTDGKGNVELRWFTHDPEVIVGEGGPPPRPPHQGRRSLKRR